VPIASIALAPFVLEVHPSVPAKTVPEFIAYAKANPGRLNVASSGNGTVPHVSGELFKMMTGINVVHVPYRGGALALGDLLTGQVQARFGGLNESIEHIKSGKLRAIAVTTAGRSDLLPDVPTIGEFVPGYEATAWAGIGAPKNTPAEIIEKLNGVINGELADPKLKAKFAAVATTVFVGSSEDFARLIRTETEKWGKVIRTANIKPE